MIKNIAAVIQMESQNNLEDNLAAVSRLLAKAANNSAKLAVLPENFAFMGANDDEKLKIAESYGRGEIQDKLAEFAAGHGMWIVAGTVPIKSNDGKKIKAASLVFNHEGKIAARYDKMHLFDVRISADEAHQESNLVSPGNEVVVIDSPIGKLGLTVCYDVRFPELYRALSEKGVEVFIIPSAFTHTTGVAHWEILMRARAIENLCYVLAANQTGMHPGRRNTYGHSMIVNPWGHIESEIADGSGVITSVIDLDKLHNIRRDFPALEHRIL